MLSLYKVDKHCIERISKICRKSAGLHELRIPEYAKQLFLGSHPKNSRGTMPIIASSVSEKEETTLETGHFLRSRVSLC